MTGFSMGVVLVCMLLCICSPSTHGQSTPPGAEDHQDGFWFGTQNLQCVLSSGTKGQTTRTKRQVSPTRHPLRIVHRLMYYRGQVYEWGNQNVGYVGLTPASPQCNVTWELQPAGRSFCPAEPPARFTREYRQRYGPYHVITNNCHYFANRLSGLLTSENCLDENTRGRPTTRPSDLQTLWGRILSFLADGTGNDEDNVPIIT